MNPVNYNARSEVARTTDALVGAALIIGVFMGMPLGAAITGLLVALL